MAHLKRDARAGGETLRDKQKRDTRQRLIEAADLVFHRRGYNEATIDEIVIEAGASRATFYLHFDSKPTVAGALFAQLADPEVRAFNERLDALGPPTRPEIREWLADVFAWFADNRVRVDAYEQALTADSAVAEAAFGYTQQAIDAMPRYLERWQGPQQEQARLRLFALIMQLHRICYFTVVRRSPLDRNALLDVLTDEWWAAMKPDAGIA